MLVALAACLALIQVNLLLPTAGRPANSFRDERPDAINTGDFIGHGIYRCRAIVRRDNFVVGITTPAPIWFVTIIGLCFGGGQTALGAVGSAIGIGILTVLKAVEDRMKQNHLGKLSLVVDSSGPGGNDIRALLARAGVKVSSCAFAYNPQAQSTELNCDLQWRNAAGDNNVPDAIHSLAQRPGVIRIAWTPQPK